MNKIENSWTQYQAIHCPINNCKGMLLQNDFMHEMKCSECGRYFESISKLIEVSKPNE